MLWERDQWMYEVEEESPEEPDVVERVDEVIHQIDERLLEIRKLEDVD